MKKSKWKFPTVLIFLTVTGIIFFRFFSYDGLYVESAVSFSDNGAVNIEPPEDSKTGKPVDVNETKRSKKASFTVPMDQRGPVNILFLGTDREGERDTYMDVYRTDTIMLFSIVPKERKIHVLQIPRDTYMYLPVSKKPDKVNHAYAFGGMGESGSKSVAEAINGFIKYTAVDNFFTVDMEPVPEIVDALGGVYVDVRDELHDGDITIRKGGQVLDGRQAYSFIRCRNTPGGDIDRIDRQRQFLMAVLHQLKDSDNMVKGAKLVMSHSRNITTDIGMDKIIALAVLAGNISGDDITFQTVPGKALIKDGIWYWMPDEEKLEKILVEFYKH